MKKNQSKMSFQKKWLVLLCSLCSTVAMADLAYLQKFQQYLHWCQHLPTTPEPSFLTFIETPTPLTRKLREKWLYQFARNRDWAHYTQYYQGSNDTNLQCYAQTALYYQGKSQEALLGAKPLWLNGGSQSKACDELFNVLLKNHEIDNNLILQRLSLALDQRNVSLARYLLKQHQPALIQEAELLSNIQQNPSRIMQLQQSSLHSQFYLYGLKLLVAKDLKLAIRLWENPYSKAMLNENQQQAFLAHLTLYKNMRQQPDAANWFAKIKPAFYNDVLLDWQIRHALAQQNWTNVIRLTEHLKNKEEPCWQYWQARAHEALGHAERANQLYTAIASKRNYYGFLANIRLKNSKFSFENEPLNLNLQSFQIYKPILDDIKNLYTTHQIWAASRLLNDFSSELTKEERSTLAYWVANDLHWYGKSVYLSNNEILNNQLALRFPLAYNTVISGYAKLYNIQPELVYAIIRQESGFHEEIVSPVGANGLMQIMPTTAKHVAARAKIPYSDVKQLYFFNKNIQIGIAYLQQLAQHFSQHPVLMAAAYNAGPRQVHYWLKQYPSKEVDIWIETLPWRETRNYLKNIMAFYAVYQYRMNINPNLQAFLKPF